jgi:hypothetical protein
VVQLRVKFIHSVCAGPVLDQLFSIFDSPQKFSLKPIEFSLKLFTLRRYLGLQHGHLTLMLGESGFYLFLDRALKLLHSVSEGKNSKTVGDFVFQFHDAGVKLSAHFLIAESQIAHHFETVDEIHNFGFEVLSLRQIKVRCHKLGVIQFVLRFFHSVIFSNGRRNQFKVVA